MTAQPGGKEQILASVLRTFEVAELLAREGEMGVTRIAREIGLDKSSVYRILATLKSIGYVCRNPATQGYSNTNRFSSLCGGFLQAENLRERAHPALADLADKAGEAASLGVLEGRDILYIDTVQCSGLIRVNVPIGQKLPAYCSSLGKAILAFLPEPRVRGLFGRRPMEKYTPKTLSSYEELQSELLAVRASGFARDLEESHEGLACLAVPVFEAGGGVIAGISLSFPRFRHPDQEETERDLVPLLRATGFRVSSELGYTGLSPACPGEAGQGK